MNYKEFVTIAVCLTISAGLIYLVAPKKHAIVYDCRLAEISPDYPVAVKEECRKLNINKGK